MDLDTNATRPSTDVLLVEYAATNSVYLQYDGFRWQAGSFLVAGVFVYWAFLVQGNSEPMVVGVSSLLIAGLMSCWLLFATHYRQLYLQKLHRLQEIEVLLGMEQHLRFVGRAPSGVKYRSDGFHGHSIDKIVYAITSVGGSGLSWAANGFSVWNIAAVPLVIATIWHVNRNEAALRKRRAAGFID